MAAEKEGAEGEAPAAPKKKLTLDLILGLVNLLVVFAGIGILVYTKIIYKKPQITEKAELDKITPAESATAEESEEGLPLISLDEMRVNIASVSGQSHYASFALSVEFSDKKASERFQQKKDILVDKLISIFNRKQLTELNTIQGRLIVKEEIIRDFNKLIGTGSVTNLYYNQFLLQ